MAKNSTIQCAAGAWTPVTDGAVSALRLQNGGGYAISVQATADNTAPTADAAGRAGAVQLAPSQALSAGMALSDLFPGVVTDAGYVWVWCPLAVEVSVSHA